MSTVDHPHLVRLQALAAGLAVSFLYFFFFWGIPFDFSGDLVYIYNTTPAVRIRTLLMIILQPFTPAWFFADDMIYLRPTQFLFLTILQRLGWLTLPTVHLLTFLQIAILCAVLFMVLWHISRSVLFAWLGVVLYGTFPTQPFSMVSIIPVDFQFLELLLILLGLLFFWNALTKGDVSWGRMCWNLAGVVAMTWMAIKLKSAAKVLPFLYLGVALLALFLRRIPLRRWVIFSCIAATLLVLVVPWIRPGIPSVKEQNSHRLSWEFALRRIFQGNTAYPFPLFTLRRNAPGSLTENYGPVAGWVLWGSLFFALVRRMRRKLASPCAGEYDLFWPILIWFLFSLAGFAIGEPPLDSSNRYLNYGLLPSVILLYACVFSQGLLRTQVPPQRKMHTLRILFAACLIFTIGQNGLLWIQSVKHMVCFQWAAVEAEKSVFRDMHQRLPKDHEELYWFHWKIRPSGMCLEWEGQGLDQAVKLLEKEGPGGVVYYLSRSEKSIEDLSQNDRGLRAEFLREIPLSHAPTLAFRFARLMHGEGKNAIFIYKLKLSEAWRFPGR